MAVIVAMTVLGLRPDYVGTREGHVDANYLNAKTCLSCHADHYASWARTYHSRMTQEARPESVQGDFERNNTLDYLGVHAQMEKRGGAFTMSLTFPDGHTQAY